MSKGGKGFAIMLVLAVLVVVAFLLIRKKNIKAAQAENKPTPTSTKPGATSTGAQAATGGGGAAPAAASLDKNKVLKSGVSGNEVRKLQEILNAAREQAIRKGAQGLPAPLTEDGNFGAKTLEMLRIFLQVAGASQTTLTEAEARYQYLFPGAPAPAVTTTEEPGFWEDLWSGLQTGWGIWG